MTKKFIIFDFWSMYGHFKKPYTTSSPLTFSVPPRTSVAGIIAAIGGIDKKTYIRYFTKNKADIAIAVKNPIKKVRLGINLLNFNDSMTKIEGKNPTRVEFLKDPKYRIYFSHNDEEIYNSIKSHILKHTSIYTPTMGLSENIANFKYVGEYKASYEPKSEDYIEVNSVIPLKRVKPGEIRFDYNHEYFTETLPLELDENRQVLDYGEILFEKSGNKIFGVFLESIYLKDIGERIIVL